MFQRKIFKTTNYGTEILKFLEIQLIFDKVCLVLMMSFQKQTCFTFESYYKLKSQAALLNFNFNQIDDLFKFNIETSNDKTSKTLLATESSWKPFRIQLNQCCWCSCDIQNTNYYLVNYYLTGIINDVSQSQSVDVFICIRDFRKFFKISF